MGKNTSGTSCPSHLLIDFVISIFVRLHTCQIHRQRLCLAQQTGSEGIILPCEMLILLLVKSKK